MIDISTIKIGDKVHYIPFEGCNESLIENGIVKEIPEHTFDSVRNVYKCGGNWKMFMDYTSALTNIRNLEKGWKRRGKQND